MRQRADSRVGPLTARGRSRPRFYRLLISHPKVAPTASAEARQEPGCSLTHSRHCWAKRASFPGGEIRVTTTGRLVVPYPNVFKGPTTRLIMVDVRALHDPFT